jgi:hypothetical protein
MSGRRHPRGWTGRTYRPRRRPAQPEPQLISTGSWDRRTAAQVRKERVQQNLAKAAVAAERARLARRDERAARLVERTKDDPMLSEPVWHVHDVNGR